MDPWYPLGYGDPLQAAFVLAHFGHMSGAAELPDLLEMITTNPARALGLDDDGPPRWAGPGQTSSSSTPRRPRTPCAASRRGSSCCETA